MHNRNRPSGTEFMGYAKSVFNFMPVSKMEETSTYYSVSFKTKSLGISISYDIRDDIVDCTIDELWEIDNGKLQIDLPSHCNLFGFLVKSRHYRGSLNKDFHSNENDLLPWQESINVYANTLQHFFSSLLRE